MQKAPKREDMFLGAGMLPTTSQELANRRDEHPATAEEIVTVKKEEEVLESPRPPVDLFKAIFASSESEESVDESEEEESEIHVPVSAVLSTATPSFSLDILESTVRNMWRDNAKSEERSESKAEDRNPEKGKIEMANLQVSSLEYGPALPPVSSGSPVFFGCYE